MTMSGFGSSFDDTHTHVLISADSEHRWPQTRKKSLFVRDCHVDLWNIVQQRYGIGDEANEVAPDEGGPEGTAIKGTPGVGKSCFLDYCLHQLLTLQKTVCYFHGKTGFTRIFKPNGTVEKYKMAGIEVSSLSQQADYLLIDPPENGDPNFLGGEYGLAGKTFILAMSPDRNTCQAIKKGASMSSLYMGPYSLEEALRMRLKSYPGVSEARVKLRFQEFGGIPRFLFETERIEHGVDLNLKETESCQVTALNDVAANLRRIDDMETSDPFKPLWTIFHMLPITRSDGTIDFTNYSIIPCRDDLGARIRDKLMDNKAIKDLWVLFRDTRDELEALRGIRYEAYAHKKILKDGLSGLAQGLTQTGLSQSGPKTITIPAHASRIRLPTNDVQAQLDAAIQRGRTSANGGYLLPHLSNFPVVDSIFIPKTQGAGKLLQVKAGNSRPLAVSYAESISALAGSTDLYFVVPDEFTMTKKLPGLSSRWKQYRIILNDDDWL